MMATRQPGAASWLLSACLHAVVMLCLWLSAAPEELKTPPPLALELWAGNAGQVAAPVATPAPAPAPAPKVAAKAPPPPPAPVQDNPAADVKVLADKAAKKPPLPEAKPAEKATPVAKAKPELAKPEPTPPVKPATSVPAKPAATPKPAAVKTDDLLAELDALPPGPGQGKVSQAGAKTGAKTGSATGQPDQKQQYGEAIKNRVRPYIVIPDGIKGNPEASVEVIILPTLEIRSTRILRSSGSAAWDQAVLAALAEVRRFPPLPKGADFADYRRITLNFRPKE
ncbi:cell envelope integrity protein TolA [Vogesella sp. DC21W]|uniref:Cell envelope integrity protein TolA n=1 Tax=Vogesella aquatica TaxID=2984206 RepID=A0ABT5J035_9NEIS|nr:cell envelope integrity protein TolA [Vogesella aquatica]MDC7718162.1 cell envelope integrity protein TolA [Vogesella aquatica]